MEYVQLLILGAGPTGLGAALQWQESGGGPCRVLEATDQPGGLAASFRDSQGFTWDLGSHLQFSHYDRYDAVLNRALRPDDWHERHRATWIWHSGSYVPYPFQLNLHRLAPELAWQSLCDLLERCRDVPVSQNFATWCDSVFGDTITRLFMRPYNEKLWTCRLEEMSCQWIAERVAVPDLREVLRSVCYQQDAVSWGPNATFRYPVTGGTGSIWKAVAALLAPDTILFRKPATRVDPWRKVVWTADGGSFHYEHLLSTVPLPALGQLLNRPPEMQPVSRLRFTRTHIVGIGLNGRAPDALENHCWSYYPQADIPFYRLTVLSNLSSACVPDPESMWSLMAEVSEPESSVFATDDVMQSVVDALTRLALIEPQRIVSRWHRRLPYGYPVPTLDRNSILAPVFSFLEPQQIYSRGRFGAWAYEISNQDHSFMQGVELVDRLTGQGRESTLQSALRWPALHTNLRNSG